MASALNEGTVTPDTSFEVPWRKQYYDDLLADSHEHPNEWLSVSQILIESSNIGTIFVQETMGRHVHRDYMAAFGLGEKTALDFPGESTGILKQADELWGSERVTVAYGQGVSSTSLQLVAAINTIANQGVYVAPEAREVDRRARRVDDRHRTVCRTSGRVARSRRADHRDDAPGRVLRLRHRRPRAGRRVCRSPARPARRTRPPTTGRTSTTTASASTTPASSASSPPTTRRSRCSSRSTNRRPAPTIASAAPRQRRCSPSSPRRSSTNSGSCRPRGRPAATPV